MKNIAYFIYSFGSFVISLFFVLLGLLAFLIPFFHSWHFAIQSFILENSTTISFFGLGLFIIGICYCWKVISYSLTRTYIVNSGKNAISVDVDLIKNYVDSYWETIAPESLVPSKLYIHKNRIHIIADLPSLPFEEQKSLIQKIEKDFSEIFTKILGYRNDFFLKISFKK